MQIRKLEERDAPAVALIHIQSIREGFLSSLGKEFLRRVYKEIACSKDAFCFVAEDNARIKGFIFCGLDTGKLFRGLIFNKGIFLAIPLLKHLLDPRVVRKIFNNIFYPNIFSADLPKAEILSVAVSSEAKGMGVGGELMKKAITEFRNRNIFRVKALTDEKNEGSNRYYVRCGFNLVSRIKHHDHYLNLYVLDFSTT